MSIELFSVEARCIARLSVRTLKHFPFDAESPFVELHGCFNVIDDQDDVIRSTGESFRCLGILDLR